MKEALGLIEVRGWAAAITAVDAAAKAADVHLIGTDTTKGSGWVIVKLGGDVAAIQVAVEAAAMAAGAVSKMVAKHVIPRPATEHK